MTKNEIIRRLFSVLCNSAGCWLLYQAWLAAGQASVLYGGIGIALLVLAWRFYLWKEPT